ncbi:MAG: hypothetical protein AAB268_02825 [Elusimicrobiota bacterium]
MPPNEDSNDWLGDLRWQGYPSLSPVRDIAGDIDHLADVPRPLRKEGIRLETLIREKEALRGELEAQRIRIGTLSGLASEFERRLSDAASSYEGAALESESARRSLEIENARLSGELESARAEIARREARELARESDLALERERRSDCEKSLLEARRRLNDQESELAAARSKGAELAGSIGELRRQAAASHKVLLQAKALTDQDVHILRAEMREFLEKFRRIQESLSDTPPGEKR